MNSPAQHEEQHITGFQIIVLLLSIVVLCSMLADSVLELPGEASRIVEFLDLIVCIIFFIDFLYRFRQAENKWQFMKWGWIDLVASIPNINILRWGRLIRVLRIIRILRGVRSLQKILSFLFRHKFKNGLGAVLTASGLMIIFSSVAILVCENGKDANIRTAEDAVWWSVTTITTVGYGDKFPITPEGRCVAAVLMICGVGLFGTLSGVIASAFLGRQVIHNPEHPDPVDLQNLANEIKVLQQKVDALSQRETWK